MVDVRVPGVRDGDCGIWSEPLAGFDSVFSVGLESGSDEALGHQRLLTGVLAIPVVASVQCFHWARSYLGRLTGAWAMVICRASGWDVAAFMGLGGGG